MVGSDARVCGHGVANRVSNTIDGKRESLFTRLLSKAVFTRTWYWLGANFLRAYLCAMVVRDEWVCDCRHGFDQLLAGDACNQSCV